MGRGVRGGSLAVALPLTAAGLPVGTPLDTSTFKFSRGIAAGDAALVAVPLDAAALAHSAGPEGRFANLRIVDGSNRQIPWLIERGAEPLVVALRAEGASPRAVELKDTAGTRHSVYRIALPYPRLPGASLVVRTNARVFRRNVQLGYERPADRRHRIRGSRVSRPRSGSTPIRQPCRPPSRCRFSHRTWPTSPWWLTRGITARCRSPGWRCCSPPIAFGSSGPRRSPRACSTATSASHRPGYDLALLAARVLGAAATEASLAPEPGVAAPAADGLIAPRMFWALIALAVVALLAVLTSLVRRSGEPAPPPNPESD